LGDGCVASLLSRSFGVSDPASAVDLGGTMSLNVVVRDRASVLRVHAPFVSRARVMALQRVRTALAASGLVVGVPELVDGRRSVVPCGPSLAELERFVSFTKPPPERSSYVWMYEAMGRLHAALADEVPAVPRPVVATYGPPGSIRRWLAVTRRSVADDPSASAIVDWVSSLVRQLTACWIPARELPQQLVHGDVRLGNVGVADSGAPAFLDFGFAAVRPRIHDLAYSLPWIVLRPDATGRPEAFDWSSVGELVAAYESAAGWKLTAIERRALGPYTAAVPLYLAAVAGYTPDPARLLEGDASFVRIAEWILANGPVLA
jgi:Ser/Thr protein kinase RdoA (MazF antagonist)